MTHLHISVPAITRGTLTRTHELNIGIFPKGLAHGSGTKMAIFGSKAWVNPVRKISVFLLFELLLFTAYNGVFYSRIS